MWPERKSLISQQSKGVLLFVEKGGGIFSGVYFGIFGRAVREGRENVVTIPLVFRA